MKQGWMRLFASVGSLATPFITNAQLAPQKTFADPDKYIDLSHYRKVLS